MLKSCLLAYLEDASLYPVVKEIVREKKIEAYFATRGEQLTQLVKDLAPYMLLIDLSGLDTGWLFRHISNVKFFRGDFPIVAIVDQEQEAVTSKAETYGCQHVIVKSDLPERLPDIVEKVLRGLLQ